MYRLIYGNKYASNTEETDKLYSREDLIGAALDFLDSLSEYELEEFLIDDKLPDDWYESVFGGYDEIENGQIIDMKRYTY